MLECLREVEERLVLYLAKKKISFIFLNHFLLFFRFKCVLHMAWKCVEGNLHLFGSERVSERKKKVFFSYSNMLARLESWHHLITHQYWILKMEFRNVFYDAGFSIDFFFLKEVELKVENWNWFWSVYESILIK